MAMRLADKTVHLAQPKPCPLPHRFGCEEGFKRPRCRFCRHTGAGVVYREHDVLPGLDLRMSGHILFIEKRIAGLDRQRTTGWHCISCIKGKVYDGAFELIWIDKRPP